MLPISKQYRLNLYSNVTHNVEIVYRCNVLYNEVTALTVHNECRLSFRQGPDPGWETDGAESGWGSADQADRQRLAMF